MMNSTDNRVIIGIFKVETGYTTINNNKLIVINYNFSLANRFINQ